MPERFLGFSAPPNPCSASADQSACAAAKSAGGAGPHFAGRGREFLVIVGSPFALRPLAGTDRPRCAGSRTKRIPLGARGSPLGRAGSNKPTPIERRRVCCLSQGKLPLLGDPRRL